MKSSLSTALTVLLVVLMGAPLGPYQLTAASAPGADGDRLTALAAQPGLMFAYHGTLHNHTGYSDGVGDPDLAFTYGQARGLDFMAVTDHSETTDDTEWVEALNQANSHTVDGVFVALRGAEYTNNQYGHANIYGTDRHPTYNYTGFGYADHTPSLPLFYAWVGQHPEAIGQFNHPGWRNFNEWEYHGEGEAGMQLAEVGCCTPPSYVWDEAEYINGLSHGWRVAPTVSADTHTDQWGIDHTGRTGIWATELTYAGVMEALRAMRVFATEDSNFDIYLQADGAWMGTAIPNNGQLDVEVYVYDPDGESVTNLALYTDNGQLVAWIVPPNNPYTWSFPIQVGDGIHYYYARAMQADANHALTAPIWTERAVTGLEASNDSPTALGQPTTLTATVAAGSNVTYTWALGDGTTGSGAHFAHTYPALGVYTAVVTANNSVSMLTATTTVVIVDEAIRGLAAVNDGPTVLGQATALTASVAAGTHISYTWSFGDGSSGSGAALTHGYPAVGSYTAVVTAANSAGIATATTVVEVDEIIAGLTAANDGPTALGNPSHLTATTEAGSRVLYSWALGDGAQGSGANLEHIYPTAGVYTAVVTAGNSVSVLTATTAVTVEEAIAGLEATNDGPTVLGQATALTASVGHGGEVAFNWELGDGTRGSGASLTHTYPAAGIYTAVVTASNSTSWLTATTVVTVEEAITGLVAANDGPTVLGQATALTASVGHGGAVAFAWELGDGTRDSGASIAHTYPAAGIYTAVVTASNSTSWLTATTVVTVEEAITGLVAVNDGPTVLGQATAFMASVVGGTHVVYSWVFGDGSPEEVGQNITHTYAAAGVYTAVVTARNSVGSAWAETRVVVVEAPPEGFVYLPVVVKGNPRQ